MTKGQRDWQDDQERVGNTENLEAGVVQLLKKGPEAAGQFVEDLQVPTGTAETVAGTILGCLTVRAFTKAWPRLQKPVNAAGYLVGGYAAYRLVKAVFDQRAEDQSPEGGASEECGRV